VREKVSEHEGLQMAGLKMVYQGRELMDDTMTIGDLKLDPTLSIIIVGKKKKKRSSSASSNEAQTTPHEPQTQQQPMPPVVRKTKEEIMIEKIDSVQQRADNLEKEVKELKEKRQELGETKYAFERRKCDEYLTRCLLDLDVIDVEGNEDIRNKRRQVIKFVQSVQSFIESNL